MREAIDADFVRYAVRRIGLLLVSLLGVSIVTFGIVNVLPGDVALLILGNRASPERLEALRQSLGLNRPIWIRYIDWLTGVLTGDMGNSLRFGDPVTRLIVQRLPASAFLAGAAVTIAVTVAIPLGVIAGRARNTWKDFTTSVVAFTGISLPDFFWGLVLILVFAEFFAVLPPSGYVNPAVDPVAGIKHVLLPAMSLGFALMAHLTRMTRSSLIEELKAGYVKLAQSKGIPDRDIVYRHALRNAFLPVLTVIGLQIGFLFSGIVIIEQVFAYPGLGRLAFQALLNRDTTLIQGSVLTIATVFMLSNLVVDLLYAVLDPRVQTGGGA
ncbi:peptide ABC transporter permease [Halorubrum ezzemoulense]|nr:peptide ABC transporter permease [Halorubrum ezzemoulense]